MPLIKIVLFFNTIHALQLLAVSSQRKVNLPPLKCGVCTVGHELEKLLKAIK